METREFLMTAGVRSEVLKAWIEAGWLMPERDRTGSFSEVDLARAHLIRDLQDMGVNDDAVPIILDLIDQVHGLRRTVRTLLSEVVTSAERAH